jgi:hypothetical protein
VNIPFVGFNLFFYLRKIQIESKIRTELLKPHAKTKTDVSFCFSRENIAEQLTWLSKREFLYCGQVYLVNKVKYDGENLIYSCTLSNETANLIENLDNVCESAARQSTDTQKASDNLNNFFNSLFSSVVNSSLTKPVFVVQNSFSNLDFNEIKAYYNVIDPPPKV